MWSTRRETLKGGTILLTGTVAMPSGNGCRPI